MHGNTRNYRISHAALGKILAEVIETEMRSESDPVQFRDTVLSVYNRILDPDFTPDSDSSHNVQEYEAMVERIEKSARRSAIAREAARRRKEVREASQQSRDRNRPESVEIPKYHSGVLKRWRKEAWRRMGRGSRGRFGARLGFDGGIHVVPLSSNGVV